MTSSSESPYYGKDLEAMSFAVNYHRWIFEELAPYITGEVAEVGAGTGAFSELLRDARPEHLHAYEPSPNMFPLLAQRISRWEGASAINGYLPSLKTNEQPVFDTIVYVNVLEHIGDDEEELRKAHRALRPGGHLLVFVPALSWLFSALDKRVGHYRRYHLPALTQLIHHSGYELVQARYFDILGVLPWYIAFVLLKGDINPEGVAFYDRVGVPLTRRLECRFNPPFGKNILLVAKKP